jgi:hypothetical protein
MRVSDGGGRGGQALCLRQVKCHAGRPGEACFSRQSLGARQRGRSAVGQFGLIGVSLTDRSQARSSTRSGVRPAVCEPRPRKFFLPRVAALPYYHLWARSFDAPVETQPRRTLSSLIPFRLVRFNPHSLKSHSPAPHFALFTGRLATLPQFRQLIGARPCESSVPTASREG